MNKLKKDASRLASDVAIFTKGKKPEWKRILENLQDNKVVVKNKQSEESGFRFQVSVVNEILNVKFFSGYSFGIDLKTGEIVNATDRDILWILYLNPKFYEPRYWDKFIKSF